MCLFFFIRLALKLFSLLVEKMMQTRMMVEAIVVMTALVGKQLMKMKWIFLMMQKRLASFFSLLGAI